MKIHDYRKRSSQSVVNSICGDTRLDFGRIVVFLTDFKTFNYSTSKVMFACHLMLYNLCSGNSVIK